MDQYFTVELIDMDTVTKMLRQIEKLEAQVASVDVEISEKQQLKADYLGQIKGLETGIKYIQKDGEEPKTPSQPRAVREGSKVHKAVLALEEKREYMSVPDIVVATGEKPEKQTCINMRSQLASNAKNKRIFKRGDGGKFGLIEWDDPEEPHQGGNDEEPTDDPVDSRWMGKGDVDEQLRSVN